MWMIDATSLGESLSVFAQDPPTFLHTAQMEKTSPVKYSDI
jgi:hypothetical protein